MGIGKNISSQNERGKAVSRKNQETSAGRDFGNNDEIRKKLLEWFPDSVKKYFKDNFKLDLSRQTGNMLSGLKNGMAVPVTVTVVPMAYNDVSKLNVKGEPITVNTAMRAVFPKGKDGKPVELDKTHKMFVTTYAYRPLLLAGDDSAQAPAAGQAPESGVKEPVKVSADIRTELEKVGVNREQLYPGNPGSLTDEQKKAILDGEVFIVDGYVKTDCGVAVNFCGKAQYDPETGSAKLVPLNLEEGRTTYNAIDLAELKASSSEALVPDVLKAAMAGSVRLNIFTEGENGVLKLNEAGQNLRDFGNALVPVEGYNVATRKKEFYTVSILDETGSADVTPMRKFNEMVDGEKKVRYEPMQVRTGIAKNKAGKEVNVVFVAGGKTPLEFKSEKEFDSYRRGFGGLVKTGKYDAFAVPDQSKGGYAVLYSEDMTKRIQEALQKSEQKKARMKAAAAMAPRRENVLGYRR